jgi:glycosyltransferase involved in cell wall biosynthesis
MDLAIIISVYNRNDIRLKNCLKSLIAQNTSQEYAIYIVDYGSDDNLPIMLSELGSDLINYLYVDKTPFNRSHANNIAIKSIDAPLVAVLDGYCLFSNNFVESLIPQAGSHSIVTCTAQPLVIPEIYLDQADLIENLDDYLQEEGVGTVPGLRRRSYQLILDRQVLLDIGGYDEDLLFSEDIDILRRVLRGGTALVRLDDLTHIWHQASSEDLEDKEERGQQDDTYANRAERITAFRRKSVIRNFNREWGAV